MAQIKSLALSVLMASATCVSGAALAPEKRQGQVFGTATVSLAEPSGAPAHLAAGIIYGLPDNTDGTANTDIPDSFITGMGLNYCRAGGAQLPDGSLGWAAGQYEPRWLSSLSNYRTTRRQGGRFSLLMHDLWGADSLQGGSFSWPGDNGNWTSYDAFLDRVFSDLRSNDALAGLDIDIWNEPDLQSFWGSTQDQYLATWARTYHRIRKDLPEVVITGPSTSEPATSGSAWWQKYTAFIAENDVVPDIYSWHLLRTNRNLRESTDQFNTLRQNNNLPEKPIVINEYASNNGDEQSPAGGVFYISQLERHNTHGLRANWGSASKLHDLLANLLGKRDGSNEYFPVGEWHVYKYYIDQMTGQRVATKPSSDEAFEVYATHDGTVGSVKVLAAVRPVAGQRTYHVTINGLSSLGFSGSRIKIRTRRFDGPTIFDEIEGSVDLGVWEHDVVSDSVTFWVQPVAVTTAFKFQVYEDQKAGGQIGEIITNALLKTGKHSVTAITRANSTSKMPSGVHVAKVDYDDDESLVKALQGQHCLIITLAMTAADDVQDKLIQAAAKAKVEFVVPNWFGIDPANEKMLADLPLPPGRAAGWKLVESLGVSSWILLSCGFWYEFSLSCGPETFGIDIKNRKIELIDDGETILGTTTWPQVGRAVAALLSLPIKPEVSEGNAASLDQFRNRIVYVSSFRSSQKDMIESVKRVTGTSDEDWVTVQQKSLDRWRDGQQKVNKGDLSGFMPQLYSRVWFPNDGADFEAKHGVSNALLGLLKEDIDTYTRVAVGKVENGTFEY
ncbi:hypothetical protein ACHAQA_005901 [Verticillium albo-atrum]